MNTNKINILVAVESPEHFDVLVRLLTLDERNRELYNCIHADTLAEAVEIPRTSEIDLVLLALTLPDCEGVETFTRFAAVHNEIPVVVLTSEDDEQHGYSALQSGAQDMASMNDANGTMLRRCVQATLYRQIARVTQKEAVTRLDELNKAKSRIVAEASHELRTPLAIIREFVGLVHDGVTGPINDKQRECLASALRNCDRLTELVNNMLDLARIESGKQEILKIRTDILPILKLIHNDFTPRCQSRKQSILLEVDPDLPDTYCDGATIKNVLINLVGNAQKFTPEGGTITILCHREGEFLTIKIRDTGPGIDKTHAESIFEAFVQVNRQDGPGAKGTGLGLAIAKKLVNLNGGYIYVESEPGRGSDFCFTLPIYAHDDAPRILIVDDEAIIRQSIIALLQSSENHFIIKSTESALEALILAGEFKPDLVILDYHLSELNGQQVLASIRQRIPDSSCKVLMISGNYDAPTPQNGVEADAFLQKPFTREELLDKVSSLIPTHS